VKFLLDSSVLIPLLLPEHEHHGAAQDWLRPIGSFAVCTITEGALVRYIFRSRPDGPAAAATILSRLAQWSGYEFWPDSVSYADADLTKVSGHKQVTDAYLVALAAHHGGRLATFDEALAAMYSEVVLIPA
jgi:toxin-antitoxin system PIN domain toxin